MLKKKAKTHGRLRRKRRIRKKISGSAQRPRLSVFRSNRHIYAQIVDDVTGETLVSASSLETDLQSELSGKDKKEQAKIIGDTVGKRGIAAGITSVVFDRNGYLYHGRVAAVADGARKSGILDGSTDAKAEG